MRIIILSLALSITAATPLPAQENQHTGLSLHDCVQIAIERNITVRSTRIDQEKSSYKTSETRAALLPKISLNGNFQNNLERSVTILPGEIFGQPGTQLAARMGSQYNTNAAISINQVLYNQTALTSLHLSKKMEKLNTLSVEKASDELASEVSKLYFLALTTTKQKALVEENIARTQRLFNIIKMLVDNGMGKQVDYERISVSLENLYTQQSNTQAMIEQQLNLIKYTLDMPLEVNILLTDTAEMPLLVQSPDVETDFSAHPDIRILESQKEINRLNQKVITSGYLPTLSFTGQYAYQGQQNELGNYFHSNNSKWYSSSYIALNLSIPLFDGLEKRSKSRQARLDYRKTSMQLDDTRERFEANYRNAVNNYHNHQNNVQRQKQNITLAEKVYQETALKYREGLSTMSDVLQDEISLSNAQLGYLNALYNFKEAELNIMSLNGEIKQLINK